MQHTLFNKLKTSQRPRLGIGAGHPTSTLTTQELTRTGLKHRA